MRSAKKYLKVKRKSHYWIHQINFRRNSFVCSLTLVAVFLMGCGGKSAPRSEEKKPSAFCNDKCEAKPGSKELSCRLTTPELDQRKATVLASLRKQILEQKELENGYAFKFPGNDKMIDELTEFAKTERNCCDFFTFNISITGDKNFVWMEIVGPKEAKQFIKTELEL